MRNSTTRLGVAVAFQLLMFARPLCCCAQDSPQGQERLVEWVRTAAVPLRPVMEDFGPIDDQLAVATVVGIGEATHGQHEAFELKRQLTMHVIRRHGYRVVAYEASASRAVSCNEYIAGESDDRARALASLGMLVWQVEENGKLLDDLRAWNQTASSTDQVRFVGCDAQAGKAILARLSQLLGKGNADIVQQLRDLQGQLDDAMQSAMRGDPMRLKALVKEARSKCEQVREVAAKQRVEGSEINLRLREFIANLELYSAPGRRDKSDVRAVVSPDQTQGPCR